MAYQLNSPNSQDDYQIDQYRLNRLGGANLDYQLAAIASQHPDWTPDQVRMAQQGALGGAPSTRLLSGAGLPAEYRITGRDFDPSQTDPVNYGRNGRPVIDRIANQNNAFRLGQIKSAQAEADKLDPDDPDDAKKLATLNGRIAAFTEEGQNQPASQSQSQLPDWALGTPNIGGGTAGEEAPVYKGDSNGTSTDLSNGGNIYFGPASGAPAFRVGSQAAAPSAPVANAPVAQPDYFPGSTPPFSIPGPITIGQDSDDAAPAAPAAAAPVASVPTSKIELRNKLKGQQNALIAANAPPAEIGSVSNRVFKLDNSITNPPAAFSAGPQDAITNAHPDWTPQQQQLAQSGFLKGAAPTAPKITSQDDYEALAPGSQYLTPDGQLFTKSGPAPAQ